MPEPSATVLVIEDDAIIRRLFNTILSANNFKVLEAADAKTGIALAINNLPDVVLMDIQLPGLDGLSATSVLRGQPATKNIPIIAVTGHVTAEHRLRAVEVGCDDFLGKPVTADTLMGVVIRALKRKAASR